MAVGLVLWAWLLTVLIWNVCGYPTGELHAWHSGTGRMMNRNLLSPGQFGSSKEDPDEPSSVEEVETPMYVVMKAVPDAVPEAIPETSLVPPPPPPPPFDQIYKPGKVIRQLSTFEYGHDASEYHEPELSLHAPLPADVEPSSSEISAPETSAPEPSHLETSGPGYPYPELDDRFFHMFITGQLPRGTVTHFSTHYEQGKNAWTDVGFEKMVPPPIVPSKMNPAAPSKLPNKRMSFAKRYPPKQ
ncbi:uncharacterized protein LOC134101473 [Sardina pilchardus]|uniref:uncharacterized protein LOC134101473 n=1 Tax=Sardina pilchardus TaxID=27697 RepID=UPI002E168556